MARSWRTVLRAGRVDHVKRLAACLFGGFVLALMVGKQEGTQNDFGIAFHEAVAATRAC